MRQLLAHRRTRSARSAAARAIKTGIVTMLSSAVVLLSAGQALAGNSWG